MKVRRSPLAALVLFAAVSSSGAQWSMVAVSNVTRMDDGVKQALIATFQQAIARAQNNPIGSSCEDTFSEAIQSLAGLDSWWWGDLDSEIVGDHTNGIHSDGHEIVISNEFKVEDSDAFGNLENASRVALFTEVLHEPAHHFHGPDHDIETGMSGLCASWAVHGNAAW